ncbi:hypothetical protein GJAV_G00058210 [Gymnothorax javanicus]|nr:hypothetical protein GJAV_G00058210 [Gymnothorax javanicus]
MSDTATNVEVVEGADLADPSPPLFGNSMCRTRTSKSRSFSNFRDDRLFVDRNFPRWDMEDRDIIWMRPKEIYPNAQFIVDGATRMDMRQGDLHDCWFLSAVASLSLHRPLLERVVPRGQSFQEGYTGRFVFRFWQYGEWQEVVIDDLLPMRDGKLMYLRSSCKEEFWSPLLEKAYAKLKGGYQSLNMGLPNEAMVDLTGGVTEFASIVALPRDLVGYLRPLLYKGSLINCGNCKGAVEKENDYGILYSHAYSLTGAERVKTSHGHVDLLRVHNPWGKVEWKGPWSDINGSEWSHVSEEEQRRVCRVNKEDGEFWMSVPDFREHFEIIEMCHLHDETQTDLGPTRRPWHCTMYHGSWVRSRTAGGPPTGGWFWQNPQFSMTLSKVDDDPSDGKPSCTVLVALMQKHKRRTGAHMALNVHIYEAHPGSTFLSSLDLTRTSPVLKLRQYDHRREVVLHGQLPPGHYIIIPSMEQPNQEGEFILRVLTDSGNTALPAEDQTIEVDLPNELPPPTEPLLPSVQATLPLLMKYCKNQSFCYPVDLLNMLKDVIGQGALAGYESSLNLEHCKSFVALMDSNGTGWLDWEEFRELWKRFRTWTDIFVKFDKNKSRSLDYSELRPALKAAGLRVDEFLIQLIGKRYTEADKTISYSGFLYLLLKLDSMILKFMTYDMVGMGTVSLNYRQWLHLTMYN